MSCRTNNTGFFSEVSTQKLLVVWPLWKLSIIHNFLPLLQKDFWLWSVGKTTQLRGRFENPPTRQRWALLRDGGFKEVHRLTRYLKLNLVNTSQNHAKPTFYPKMVHKSNYRWFLLVPIGSFYMNYGSLLVDIYYIVDGSYWFQLYPFILHNSGFKSSPGPHDRRGRRRRRRWGTGLGAAGAPWGLGNAGLGTPVGDVISPSELGIDPMISQEMTLKIRDIPRNYSPWYTSSCFMWKSANDCHKPIKKGDDLGMPHDIYIYRVAPQKDAENKV